MIAPEHYFEEGLKETFQPKELPTFFLDSCVEPSIKSIAVCKTDQIFSGIERVVDKQTREANLFYLCVCFIITR